MSRLQRSKFIEKSLEAQPALLREYQHKFNPLVVKDGGTLKSILEILSKQKDIFGGRLRTIKNTPHTTELKKQLFLFTKTQLH